MKYYERLTKNIDGVNKVDASILKNLDGKDLVIVEYSGIIQKVIDRLAELEDKIENGTFVELPCPEGTTIYSLWFDKEDPCSWCEHDHSGFGDTICDLDYSEYPSVEEYINGEPICPQFKMQIAEQVFDLRFWARQRQWFGITWFLTEGEAKAKLKELQNER